MPATKRAAKPAAQSRKSVPSRVTPGMARWSDRSRLQAPKSAASKARSKAAMNKKVTSAFKNLQAARPKQRPAMPEPAMPELRPMSRASNPRRKLGTRRPILLKPARRPIKRVPRIGESRSRLRRS